MFTLLKSMFSTSDNEDALKILIIGESESGKTSLFNSISTFDGKKKQDILNTEFIKNNTASVNCSLGFNTKSIKFENKKIKIYDLEGTQSNIIDIYDCYYDDTDIIFYVIDSKSEKHIFNTIIYLCYLYKTENNNKWLENSVEIPHVSTNGILEEEEEEDEDDDDDEDQLRKTKKVEKGKHIKPIVILANKWEDTHSCFSAPCIYNYIKTINVYENNKFWNFLLSTENYFLSYYLKLLHESVVFHFVKNKNDVDKFLEKEKMDEKCYYDTINKSKLLIKKITKENKNFIGVDDIENNELLTIFMKNIINDFINNYKNIPIEVYSISVHNNKGIYDVLENICNKYYKKRETCSNENKWNRTKQQNKKESVTNNTENNSNNYKMKKEYTNVENGLICANDNELYNTSIKYSNSNSSQKKENGNIDKTDKIDNEKKKKLLSWYSLDNSLNNSGSIKMEEQKKSSPKGINYSPTTNNTVTHVERAKNNKKNNTKSSSNTKKEIYQMNSQSIRLFVEHMQFLYFDKEANYEHIFCDAPFAFHKQTRGKTKEKHLRKQGKEKEKEKELNKEEKKMTAIEKTKETGEIENTEDAEEAGKMEMEMEMKAQEIKKEEMRTEKIKKKEMRTEEIEKGEMQEEEIKKEEMREDKIKKMEIGTEKAINENEERDKMNWRAEEIKKMKTSEKEIINENEKCQEKGSDVHKVDENKEISGKDSSKDDFKKIKTHIHEDHIYNDNKKINEQADKSNIEKTYDEKIIKKVEAKGNTGSKKNHQVKTEQKQFDNIKKGEKTTGKRQEDKKIYIENENTENEEKYDDNDADFKDEKKSEFSINIYINEDDFCEDKEQEESNKEHLYNEDDTYSYNKEHLNSSTIKKKDNHLNNFNLSEDMYFNTISNLSSISLLDENTVLKLTERGEDSCKSVSKHLSQKYFQNCVQEDVLLKEMQNISCGKKQKEIDGHRRCLGEEVVTQELSNSGSDPRVDSSSSEEKSYKKETRNKIEDAQKCSDNTCNNDFKLDIIGNCSFYKESNIPYKEEKTKIEKIYKEKISKNRCVLIRQKKKKKIRTIYQSVMRDYEKCSDSVENINTINCMYIDSSIRK